MLLARAGESEEIACRRVLSRRMAQPIATTSVRQAFTQVYVIDLAGELTSSVEPALLSAYQQANSNGSRVVILNFKQLAYKNSSGITLLVALLARCNTAGQRHLLFRAAD